MRHLIFFKLLILNFNLGQLCMGARLPRALAFSISAKAFFCEGAMIMRLTARNRLGNCCAIDHTLCYEALIRKASVTIASIKNT